MNIHPLQFEFLFEEAAFGFVSYWVTALLFTASFFTSVGNFTVNLPKGWRLIPSIIAFSGLFSFAWPTASSIAMARTLNAISYSPFGI